MESLTVRLLNLPLYDGEYKPRVKYLLCGISCPGDQKMLNVPYMWITVMAATVHPTPHEMRRHTIKDAMANNLITVG